MNPSEVLPNKGNIINLKGPQVPLLANGVDGITILIDYNKLCETVLRKVKRTPEGLITDEALIDCFMLLTREEEEK